MEPNREEEIEVFLGSGNVFADLGLPNPEERQLKADLWIQIRQAIQDKKLSRAQAMRTLGLSKEEFAHLDKGPSAHFTLDQLFHWLTRLGLTVEVRVTAAPEPPPKDAALTDIAA